MADIDDDLTIKNLTNFITTQEVTFAHQFGGKVSRKLTVTLNGFYKVYKGDDVIIKTRVASKALAKYKLLKAIKDGKDS